MHVVFIQHNSLLISLIGIYSIYIKFLQVKSLKKSTQFHVIRTFVVIYEVSKFTHFLKKTFLEKILL